MSATGRRAGDELPPSFRPRKARREWLARDAMSRSERQSGSSSEGDDDAERDRGVESRA